MEITLCTVFVDGETGAYGICFPDLPGCGATLATLKETTKAPLRRCGIGRELRPNAEPI
jgi:hypothetical protein